MEIKTYSEQEIWRPVNGFEDKYEVSNLGRIITNNWNRTGQRREMKTYLNRKTGYIHVVLQSNGKMRTTTVHRVVAEAFIPNPENLEQVDHIDNDKTNNTVKNLRWVSRKFNNSRPHAIEMRKQNHKYTRHAHQFVKAERDGEVRYFKNSNHASREFGCSNATVIKALNGQSRTARGWVVTYVDRNLPECADLRHQVWLEKMNRVTPSERKRMEVRDLSNKRKERLNHRIQEIRRQWNADVLERAMKGLPRQRHSKTLEEVVIDLRREAKAVLQIDNDGNTVREWDNTFQAEHSLGLTGIKNALFGMCSEVGGFIWKWKLPI